MENINNLRNDERALNRFISAHEKEIGRIASQFAGRGLSLDELKQEGRLGLWAAIRNYEGRNGAAFETVMYDYIIGYMKNAVKNGISENAIDDMELDTMSVRKKDKVKELQDHTLERSNFNKGTALDIIDKMLGLLSERDAWVIRWKYGIGDAEDKPVPVNEIAKRLHISRQAVHDIVNKSLDIIRNSDLSQDLWKVMRS